MAHPSGIILAGAWLDLLPPQEIVTEITRGLDFLESKAADIPERQRSLRAVLRQLVEITECGGTVRLPAPVCVSRGAFRGKPPRKWAMSAIRTLLSLANKSWLLQTTDGRYLLHDLMRQFGMEHLQADPNEWQATKQRHAEFFSTFLQAQGRALRTSRQIAGLQAIKSELESNLPDAWDWLVTNQHIDLLIETMLPGLFHYNLIRSGSPELINLLKTSPQSCTHLWGPQGFTSTSHPRNG